MLKQMPSPRGTNHEGLYLRPPLAQDAALEGFDPQQVREWICENLQPNDITALVAALQEHVSGLGAAAQDDDPDGIKEAEEKRGVTGDRRKRSRPLQTADQKRAYDSMFPNAGRIYR